MMIMSALKFYFKFFSVTLLIYHRDSRKRNKNIKGFNDNKKSLVERKCLANNNLNLTLHFLVSKSDLKRCWKSLFLTKNLLTRCPSTSRSSGSTSRAAKLKSRWYDFGSRIACFKRHHTWCHHDESCQNRNGKRIMCVIMGCSRPRKRKLCHP